VRIEVDENIGGSGVAILTQGGHDVMTVREQGLARSADERVFQACTNEGRTLVTMDRDFGNVRRFPPKQTAGIVILDLGGPASLGLLPRSSAQLSIARHNAPGQR
jgi:predicted nuclease of predicted toxin-antitoxin system